MYRKKVRFTPVNIIKNWIFNHLGFIIIPPLKDTNLQIHPLLEHNENELQHNKYHEVQHLIINLIKEYQLNLL